MRVRPPLARKIHSSSAAESALLSSSADAKSFAEAALGPNCTSKTDVGPSQSDGRFAFSARLIC